VSCSDLGQPDNGMIECALGDDGVASYQDTCRLSCAEGYHLSGSTSRTCQSDGTWSGSSSTCDRGMLTWSSKFHVILTINQLVTIVFAKLIMNAAQIWHHDHPNYKI